MKIIIGIVVISFVFIRVYKAKIKGYIGEKQVSKRLRKLNKRKYKVLNNVLLKTANGSTQIDHVVISIYGIFVIETKNYKGLIFGSENDENWTQVIYKNKGKFRNPIKQNYGHVLSIRERLSLDSSTNINPIVVFTNRATLKVNTKSPVMYDNNVIDYIRSCNSIVMSIDMVTRIYYDLLMFNIDSKDVRKEHVHKIKSNLSAREKKIQNNICPRCGKALVMRNGKNGSFIGCSGFPKCRFIRN